MRIQAVNIIKRLPKTCQIVLFSATFPEDTMDIVKEQVPRPRVEIFLE
jgi:superfamily II DNA/RNA helicase